MSPRLRHVFRRAFRSLWENAYLNSVSAGVIAATTLLFGVYLSVQFNLNKMVDTWDRDIHISAYFHPDVPENRRFDVRDEIASRPEVIRVRYVSSESANEWMQARMPAMEDILKDLKNFEIRIIDIIRSVIEKYWLKKDQLERRISVSNPQQKIKNNLIESSKIKERLKYVLTQKILNCNNEIKSFHKRLISLGPENVLQRGFTIAFDNLGRIIKSPEHLSNGEEFKLKTAKGSFKAKKIIKL